MAVVVVGANHRTAPLELLERMAVDADRMPKLLHGLDAGEHSSEVAVLATCNRTEVYLIAERFHGTYDEVRDFFADLTYLPPEHFADNLYVHYDEAAVRHLFEVVAGLDSAVPGEHEIHGQVRQAWELAMSEGTARRGLNLLFRHAVEVGKRARSETRIGQGITSVSQAAVLLAAQRLESLQGRTVMVVGAGSVGRAVASFLSDAGVGTLVVANRSLAAAESLVEQTRLRAPETQARAVGLDALADELVTCDVVISATDSPDPVIDVHTVASTLERRTSPLLVVDVAMPRDIDPRVALLDGVDVLDMGDVAAFTEASKAERAREVVAVQAIVDEEILRFEAAASAREVAPVIGSLHDHAEQVRAAELDRFASRLAGLDPADREVVEALTRGLVAKLLHGPSVRLKDAAGTAQGDRLADSIRDLFDLP